MLQTTSSGNTAIADVKSYAQGFVQKFTPGTDQVGLVVFDGSAVVGYPTVRPWDSTTTALSTGGPDASFLSQNGTACCDMVYQIKAVNAENGTNMAEGLWLAYIELQKAHMKSLASDGVDTRLNSIVLFTDGAPGAVTVDLNQPGADSLKSSSPCTRKSSWPTYKMRGWIANGGPPPWSGRPDNIYWPRMLAAFDGNTANWWMSHAGDDYTDIKNGSAPFAGCSAPAVTSDSNHLLGGSSSTDSAMDDLAKIPAIDAWGNTMSGTAYEDSEYINIAGTALVTPNPVYNGTALNRTSVTSAYHWGLAYWNAAYSAADRIRSDANLINRPGDTQNMAVAIYAIGYTGNAGIDQGLLRDIANDKSADHYNSTHPTGMYVPASDATALANAFTTVASAILRLKY